MENKISTRILYFIFHILCKTVRIIITKEINKKVD